MIALVIAFVIGFPAVCGAAFMLVWRICELHDRRLNDLLDRVQAPEVKHAALVDDLFHPRTQTDVVDVFPPVPLDEDFRLAEMIEESV